MPDTNTDPRPAEHVAPDKTMMMELMERVWPLHRTLVADDMDKALDIIAEYLPSQGESKMHRYASGMPVWTWTVPEKFVVEEAYLELLTDDGPKRIVDFADNPLHIVSYSPAFEGELSFEELEPHLYTSKKRPDAVPWIFKYYDRDWGFCLTQNEFDKLPRDGRYRAVVRTRFDPGELSVLEYTLPGESDEYFLIVCAVCHPMQVNDSITGVSVAVDFARRRAAEAPGSLGLKILFLPETIGSIAYFANNEDVIEKCRFGLFTEFVGNDAPLRLQRSREGDTLIDDIARHVLKERTGDNFIDGPFCHTVITNDEKVTNAPGVDIPTIALNRWPEGGWDRYHTDDDNPAAMNLDLMADVSEIYDDMFDILQTNVYPRRKFKGPLFLSGIKLDFDWNSQPHIRRAMRDIIYNLEGGKSVFDLAVISGISYHNVRDAVRAMAAADLVELSPNPWSQHS